MQIAWTATSATSAAAPTRSANPRGGDAEQHAHLFGPYSATIGPDGDPVHGGWTWAVHHVGRDEPVVTGYAYDERDAKHAVADWARPRAPRSWRRRLRALGRSRR